MQCCSSPLCKGTRERIAAVWLEFSICTIFPFSLPPCPPASLTTVLLCFYERSSICCHTWAHVLAFRAWILSPHASSCRFIMFLPMTESCSFYMCHIPPCLYSACSLPFICEQTLSWFQILALLNGATGCLQCKHPFALLHTDLSSLSHILSNRVI